MARDITFGIRLKADGSGFAGEVKIAGAEVEKFGRQVQQTARQTDAATKDMEGSLRRAATVGTLLGNVIADVARGAMTALPNMISELDQLDKTAQGLGTTAVALSELQTGARLAGVGAGQFDIALARLNQRLTDAANGGKESGALFKAMGIEVTDANGAVREGAVVIGEMADRFRGWRDGAEKGTLAAEAFGKAAGPRMVGWLNEGSGALRVSSGVTEELVAQAKAAQQEIDRLDVEFGRFSNNLLASVLPAINDVMEDVRIATTVFGGFWAAVAKVNPLTAGDPAKRIREITEEIARLQEIREKGSLGRESWLKPAQRALAGASVDDEIAEQRKLLRYFQMRQSTGGNAQFGSEAARLEAAFNGAGSRPPAPRAGGSGGRTGGAGRAAREERDDYARLADQVRERIALFGAELEGGEKLSESEKTRVRVLADLAAGQLNLKTGTEGELRALLDLAVALDAETQARREAAEWMERVNEAARRQTEQEAAIRARAAQDLERFLADMELEVALMGRSNAERQQAVLLRNLEAAGIRAGSEEYERLLPLIERAGRKVQELEAADRIVGAIDEAAAAAGRFGEAFVLSFGDAGNAIKMLEQDLLRLGTRLLVTEPIEKLARGLLSNEIGGGAGSSGMFDFVGNLFIKAFGMHGGGIAGQDASFTRVMPAAAFRRAPRLHLGGMAGGEVPAVLQAGEEVLTRRDPRHRANGGGRGGVAVTINVGSGQQVTRQTTQQITAGFARALAQADARLN